MKAAQWLLIKTMTAAMHIFKVCHVHGMTCAPNTVRARHRHGMCACKRMNMCCDTLNVDAHQPKRDIKAHIPGRPRGMAVVLLRAAGAGDRWDLGSRNKLSQ